MGWCSGTEVFDPVAKFILSSDEPDEKKVALLRVLIDALEDHDWDCQDDSRYSDHPIFRRVMADLHPDWYEDETDGDA